MKFLFYLMLVLLLVLTTPVWAVVGWEFHRGALKTLRHASANMDTLVSLGSTASYLLSVVATFFPSLAGGITFYDTTALIVTLIFLGKYLEARAMGQTNDLYAQAVAIVMRDRKASTSYIQRRLQIGYNRAASLMEKMELEGIVGAANHAGKREILVGEPEHASY